MHKQHITLTALTLALAVCRFAPARNESYVKDGTYVTPHFEWCNPSEDGPIEALVIAPATGSRDVWDLAQRLPLEHTVFQVNNNSGKFGSPVIFGSSVVKFASWFDYEQRRAELNAILDENLFDLIVLANVCWSSLPMDIIYKISAQAVNGAGVIMVNARFNDPMLEALYTRHPVGDGLELFQPFPFGALEKGSAWKDDMAPIPMLGKTVPYSIPAGRMMAYQVGKGRFLTMPFPDTPWGGWAAVPSLIPGFDVNMRNLWQEEYYYALMAKAFRWAAGRTPSALLREVLPRSGKPS